MTNHERDALKEALRYEIEVLRFLALPTIGLGGGTVTLVLGDFTPLRIGLAALGFLGPVILIVALVFTFTYSGIHCPTARRVMSGMEWIAFASGAGTIIVLVVLGWKISRP